MKKNLLMLLIIMANFSCYHNLESDFQELKNELDIQKELIQALQNSISITNITSTNDGYSIEFSDNSSINLFNGKTPLIEIGTEGYWIINGENTGISALGIEGNTPIIKIDENGNWLINGEETGITALGNDGNDGNDAPNITSIVHTETDFIFNFSDGSELIIPIINSLKQIVCWGDSLTAGNSYPTVLQDLLGDEYKVINCGVGGENSLTIAARQGGLPMFITKSFTIPSTTETIILGNRNEIPFNSTYNNEKSITPLLQGGSSTINNCLIDNNNCIIRWTGNKWNDPNGNWTLQRAFEGDSYIVPAKSIVFTSSMRKYRNLYANVFFIGQNGGFSDNNDLIEQYERMIQFSGSSNSIIIGLHKYGNVDRMKSLEESMTQNFGALFINLREYLSTNALKDGNLTPTESDIAAMEKGECPPQLLSDGVHFTSEAKSLIGKLVYNRMLSLGIIE